MEDSLTLPALFRRSLTNASKSQSIPTTSDETQDLIQSSLTDLRLVESRIRILSLFSPNESLEDISTRYLVYLLVPWVHSYVLDRVRITDPEQRVKVIDSELKILEEFVSSLQTYSIIPQSYRELYRRRASLVADPAKKRELKIKQYKQEKEIRTKIETIQKRRRLPSFESSNATEFELISTLLPHKDTASKDEDEDEDEDEDSETDSILREATLLLLRLAYVQSYAQLESLDQELQLLKSRPPEPSQIKHRSDASEDQRGKEMAWKLDAPSDQGPLLDAQGKPLRTFTLLPAGTTDRARLQGTVFGPGYNPPTMTIDEYLDIEKARGGIIQGGGPLNGLTESEQLLVDSEQDGTVFGEQKAEEKRLKDEKWTQFTDANPRGAGNTMNRG